MKGNKLVEYRAQLESTQTRNLTLIKKLCEFCYNEYESEEVITSEYHKLSGYLLACNDHFDLEDLERERVQTILDKVYSEKNCADVPSTKTLLFAGAITVLGCFGAAGILMAALWLMPKFS